MEQLILFLIFFIITYLVYVFFVITKPRQLEKYKNSTEMVILHKKYKIDVNKDIKRLSHITALSNAFIISTTLSLIGFIDNIILKFLLGFIVLIILIITIYHIIGISLYKKQMRKK